MRIVADGDPANGHQAVFVTVAGRDLSAIPNGKDTSMCPYLCAYIHISIHIHTYVRMYVCIYINTYSIGQMRFFFKFFLCEKIE
jgi:hypothetical protein